jgi:hypothetical protein
MLKRLSAIALAAGLCVAILSAPAAAQKVKVQWL